MGLTLSNAGWSILVLFGLFLSDTIIITNADLIDSTGKVNLTLEPTENGVNIQLLRENNTKTVGTIGVGRNFSEVTCLGEDSCTIEETIGIKIEAIENGFSVKWETEDLDAVFEDCISFETGVYWYGGPQRYIQEWPIQLTAISEDEAYVIKKSDNFAVAERYWLNSLGGYIFIGDKTPLFVDQNDKRFDQVCLIAKIDGPYINRTRVLLEYKLIALDDPKEAHLHAVNTYLGKPAGHPDPRMIQEPIFTTWAKFKKVISDDIVLGFADDILSHGFTKGQIEIDEDWETCFGAHQFKTDKFANISNTVKKLKENYRVTLWVHPFVNSECEETVNEGLEKGYFVKNTEGNMTTVWWESNNAYQIDFTNSEAAEWFTDKLKLLQKNPGIDSFKFDAGETNYVAQPAVYDKVDDYELVPNIFTQSYIKTVAQFGDLIEARSAWRTQNYSFFLRMIDKDSVWGFDDGLGSLIPTLLQMNLNGYTMVLPDMIGGNGYRQQPTAELIMRWTQATVFMPAMQFSYLPWDFPSSDEFNATEIMKNMVDLHETYAPEIIKAMEASIKDGTPVNAPIWWADPTDSIALGISSEYMLGENILVAPILSENTRIRDIYLPAGRWKDGNTGDTLPGQIWLTYLAKFDIVPFFIRQDEN